MYTKEDSHIAYIVADREYVFDNLRSTKAERALNLYCSNNISYFNGVFYEDRIFTIT